MTNHQSNWADLPNEILELIGARLEARIDIFRFRAICTSWRSIIPFSQVNSTLYPTNLIDLPLPFNGTAFLSPVTFYRLENDTRTAACLIKVVQSTSPGKMKILNPLSSRNTINQRLGSTCKSINILNLRVVEVAKGSCLKFSAMGSRVIVKKVVLFGKSTCGILVIYDAGKLGYFGFKDGSWSVLGAEMTKYDDIAVYNGQFYVIDSIGTVFWIDGNSMSLVQFSPPLFGVGQVKNLVVSDGELFVVDSYIDDGTTMPRLVGNFERVDMRIYRLDEEWGTWVEVNSLGDRVFVLGKELCFSVSIKDFPGCHRNCVYFIDSKLDDWHIHIIGDFRPGFARVFDIDDRRRMKTVESFPSHRKLFFLPMNFPCTMLSSESDDDAI